MKSTTLNLKLRRSVFERDEYACTCCGSVRWLTVDHIVPISKGGTDQIGNLQTLCRACNASKGAAGQCFCPTRLAHTGHPGRVLEDERLKRDWSKSDLALRLGFSVQYVSDVTNERRGISVKLAMALERVLGSPADYWMGLQTAYDLSEARKAT